MKKQNKNATMWRQNEDKAIQMTDKFIAILEKLDCYSNWSTILIERMIAKKQSDATLNGKIEVDDVIDTLQYSFGFTVIKAESLAEQMKVEAFLQELSENPYQLKLTV